MYIFHNFIVTEGFILIPCNLELSKLTKIIKSKKYI